MPVGEPFFPVECQGNQISNAVPDLDALTEAKVNHQIDAKVLEARPGLMCKREIDRSEWIQPVYEHVPGPVVSKKDGAQDGLSWPSRIIVANLIVILVVVKMYNIGVASSILVITEHHICPIPNSELCTIQLSRTYQHP